MNSAQELAERMKNDRASARMAKSATLDPRGPTAPLRGGMPTGAEKLPSPAPMDGSRQAASDAASMGGAVDRGGPAKVYGDNAPTNDPLSYLGHFANDDVTAEGHNTGDKPKGVAYYKGNAMKGYRVLPGTAVGQIGNARFGEVPTGHESRADKHRKAQFEQELARAPQSSAIYRTPMPVVMTGKRKRGGK